MLPRAIFKMDTAKYMSSEISHPMFYADGCMGSSLQKHPCKRQFSKDYNQVKVPRIVVRHYPVIGKWCWRTRRNLLYSKEAYSTSYLYEIIFQVYLQFTCY